VGSGGKAGMVNDDSETFGLDNLESEVAGGAWKLFYISPLPPCS
jgi:hypothetical protein